MSDRYPLKSSPYGGHQMLLELFPAPGGGRTVLDLGCGDGHFAGLLAERGYTVTAVERESAAACPASVKLIEYDLEQGLPALESRFDYVLCADVLEHLRDPLSILRGLPDLLKPGGVLVASLPNSGNIYFRLNILLGRFPQDERGLFDRTHLRFFMWKGWQDLFAQAGLTIGTVKSTGIPFSLVMPPGPAAAMEMFYSGFARVWKTVFAYQFIVTAAPATRR